MWHPGTPKPPTSVANITAVEAYLNKLVEFGTPPGLSLVVVKKNDVIYNKSFGVADGPNKILATPDTIYKWWSLTKIFTTTAILQLHEQGLLDIDDPVTKYLPFFEVQYPSESSDHITIRHVLNHSSGLPNNIPEVFGWMHLEGASRPDQTELLKQVLPGYARLKFEPGTKAMYTNVGYMVLGAIIEAVSQRTYENYIAKHILQPLKMDHTNFVYTDKMLPYAAVGSHPVISLESIFLPFFYYGRLRTFIYEVDGGRMWFNRFYADSDPPSGLIGPATDLARFVITYLNGGELDGKRILLPETVTIMSYEGYIFTRKRFQPHAPVHGLGWKVFSEGEDLYLQHNGRGPGFGSALRVYPKKLLGLIVIANDTTYDRDAILDLVASLSWE